MSKKKQTTLYLEPELTKIIKETAIREDTSMTKLIEKILKKHFKYKIKNKEV